ncbi:MAG: PilZ domain-containing protein [Deltaproteobacteria bacterium]|nr:PilZ domain-containing protein [Deltaproteobacteria bacterium]
MKPVPPPPKESAKLPDEKDRREEPRYAFDDNSKIYAHLGPRAFRILNISVGGVAFFSDMYFAPGTKLLMSALGMIALDVEVLNCDIEETNSDLMEFKYRVRAKFGPRVNGYQVYVLAREMYLQEGGQLPEGEDPGSRRQPGPAIPPKE